MHPSHSTDRKRREVLRQGSCTLLNRPDSVIIGPIKISTPFWDRTGIPERMRHFELEEMQGEQTPLKNPCIAIVMQRFLLIHVVEAFLLGLHSAMNTELLTVVPQCLLALEM